MKKLLTDELIARGQYWHQFCDVFNGCEKVSPACQNCWAIPNCWRMAASPNAKLKARYGGLVDKHMGPWGIEYDWTGKHTVDWSPLERLYEKKKPQVVAFSWRGDWMCDWTDTKDIDTALDLMGSLKRHTFLTLTKRPQNIEGKLYGITKDNGCRELGGGDFYRNIWIGVSAWDQPSFDTARECLAPLPFKTFVSLEPMLGPVRVTMRDKQPDWIICGGESGLGARSLDAQWVRDLEADCYSENIPFFFKQWHGKLGRVIDGHACDGLPELGA